MDMAWNELRERVDDGDDRTAEMLLAHPARPPQSARSRHLAPGGRYAASERSHVFFLSLLPLRFTKLHAGRLAVKPDIAIRYDVQSANFYRIQMNSRDIPAALRRPPAKLHFAKLLRFVKNKKI
jgi:hypothetical protein